MDIDISTAALLTLLAPLFSGALVGIANKYLHRHLAHGLTILAMLISFSLSLYIYNYAPSIPLDKTLYSWGISGQITFQVGLWLDNLTAIMLVVVNFISLIVHIYTIGYMRDDKGYNRFFAYISLFTFAMLTLVMANNFLQLFFAWEAVGLMSYLLIGFWYKKESAIVANLKAFLVNRLGDVGFIFGIFGLIAWLNSTDYQVLFNAISNKQLPVAFVLAGYPIDLLNWITIALFIGAMAKSAQIPLHVWLPDSMEGPTPISALIHAATMVTAGIFLLARLAPLYQLATFSLNIILVIGATTCVLMGLLGIVQRDIKKIIAYSTLSQLGLMITACGAGCYNLAMFHLVTHAFFKALLFLGAGNVITAMHHEQDIWRMGGLGKYLPITHILMLIGTLALVGFPGFSGFVSKDLLLEGLSNSSLWASHYAYSCALVGVFITSFYSFRLYFVVFWRSGKAASPHEVPFIMYGPLLLLSIPAIFSGLAVELFLQKLPSYSAIDWHGMLALIVHASKHPALYLMLSGLVLAYLLYIPNHSILERLKILFAPIYQLLLNKYGFDVFYHKVVTQSARMVGNLCRRLGDELIIDQLTVNGSAYLVHKSSRLLKRIQTGYLYHYAFVMIAGLIVIIVWLMWN